MIVFIVPVVRQNIGHLSSFRLFAKDARTSGCFCGGWCDHGLGRVVFVSPGLKFVHQFLVQLVIGRARASDFCFVLFRGNERNGMCSSLVTGTGVDRVNMGSFEGVFGLIQEYRFLFHKDHRIFSSQRNAISVARIDLNRFKGNGESLHDDDGLDMGD